MIAETGQLMAFILGVLIAMIVRSRKIRAYEIKNFSKIK